MSTTHIKHQTKQRIKHKTKQLASWSGDAEVYNASRAATWEVAIK
jgi:hypothetical protein